MGFAIGWICGVGSCVLVAVFILLTLNHLGLLKDAAKDALLDERVGTAERAIAQLSMLFARNERIGNTPTEVDPLSDAPVTHSALET
jgi:hypothetical protein